MSAVATIEAFASRAGIVDVMNTAWAWPIAESLHFMGLALLLGSVGIVDLRLIGVCRHQLPLATLHPITRWGLIGFGLNVVTGVAFFVSDPGQYLYNPAFQLKTLGIFIAFINAIGFYAFVWPRIRARDDLTLPTAKLCAAISLSAWTAVIVCGRLITFYRPPEHWCFWCT